VSVVDPGDLALGEVQRLRGVVSRLAFALYTHARTDLAPDAALPALRELVQELGGDPGAETAGLGRWGYEAYARSTGGKTFDGRAMPAWSELPDRIQRAWDEAAFAVCNHHDGGDVGGRS
jgi:hypothetical protein